MGDLRLRRRELERPLPETTAVPPKVATDETLDVAERWVPSRWEATQPGLEAGPIDQRQSWSAESSAWIARVPAQWSASELERAELTHVLLAAGLTLDDASALLQRGATAEQATEMLNLRVYAPELERFGSAAFATRLVLEARMAGVISPGRVRELFRRYQDLVIVRPDGVLTTALTGEPLERRALRLHHGVGYAGSLEVGGLYHLQDGVLRAVDELLSPGPVVGELAPNGLTEAALDGVADAYVELILSIGHGIEGLIDQPVEQAVAMVSAFGGLPHTVTELIRRSPALLAEYRRLPEQDRVRAASKLVTSALMFVAGGGEALLGLKLTGGGMGMGLGMAQLADGGLVLVRGDALVLASGPERLAGLVLMAAAANSAATGGGEGAPRINGLDARGQMKLEKRLRHGVGDLLDPKSVAVEDLPLALELAAEVSSNARLLAARLIAQRVVAEIGEATWAQRAALAALARKMGGEIEQAASAAMRDRVPEEIGRLKGMAEGRDRTRAIQALREAADAMGLDLHKVLQRGPAPPLASLSLEAQRAVSAVRRGQEAITVSSRRVAEEVLSQYPKLVDTGDWGWTMIKGLLPTKATDTMHWDEVFGADGRILHHPPPNPHGTMPHLQLELLERTVRIEWPRGQP